jgi:protocatechuate 3,4-dioxygenase alpha subunit
MTHAITEGAEFSYPPDDQVTASAGPTPWQTVGPFFHDALPYPSGPSVAGGERPGAFLLAGRVLDGAGEPIVDALVEIWQADEHGRFVSAPGIYPEPGHDGFRGFGRSDTDRDGRFRFRTVRPGAVPTLDGDPQAPHIAMSVFARGMLRRAVTRVYFEDEQAANASDPLLAALAEQRRATLVATRTGDGYRFDVRIQGDDETVFLDVPR